MRINKGLIFIFPGAYTKHSRHKSLKDILGFSMKYFIPILLFIVWRDHSILRLLFGFILTYDLYEIGYIENDCETIKKEKNPTLRLSAEDFAFYELHKLFIYLAKSVIFIAIGVYLLIWDRANFLVVLFPLLLIPTYLIYNRIRCRWNLILHAFLMFIRYYAPVLISTYFFSWTDALAFLFVYPIKGMIEISVMGKFSGYKNKFVQKYILHDFSNFQLFRLKYYFIGVLITGFLLWQQKVDISIFVIYTYFLLFTFISMNSIGKHKNER